MVWYNPMTWFSSQEETPAPEKMAYGETPAPGPYGGRKKTRRSKKAKATKRRRTGKSSSRS